MAGYLVALATLLVQPKPPALDCVWVIEAKPRLGCEALGQVLLYGDLYEAENKEKTVKLGIVCCDLEVEVLATCHKRRISVFEVAEDGARALHSP